MVDGQRWLIERDKKKDRLEGLEREQELCSLMIILVADSKSLTANGRRAMVFRYLKVQCGAPITQSS
jgi:hypothetical protein